MEEASPVCYEALALLPFSSVAHLSCLVLFRARFFILYTEIAENQTQKDTKMDPIYIPYQTHDNSDGPRVRGTIYNRATIVRLPITELYQAKKEEKESMLDFEPDLGKFAKLPEEMRKRKQWIVWRLEARTDVYGNLKVTQPAINPKTGQYANLKSAETWSSLKEAVDVYESSRGLYRGIGFVFTKDDPFFGVDLEECFRDVPTSELTYKILKELHTYTEYARNSSGGGPLKIGLHLIGIGSIPEGATHEHPSIEMYDRERYLPITASSYRNQLPIRECQEPLNTIHASLFGSQPLSLPQSSASTSSSSFSSSSASSSASSSSSASAPPAPPALPAPPAPPVAEQARIRPIQSFFTPAPRAAIDIPDEKLLDLAANAKNGSLFSRLWAGDWTIYPRKFQADLAFCGMLAFWTAGDGQRINQLFQQSGLYCPEQWHQERREGGTYGYATIKRAISGCHTFYKPPRQACPWLEAAKAEANQIEWNELSKIARKLAKEQREAEAPQDNPSALPKSGASRHTLRTVHLAMLELTRIANKLEINVSSRRLSNMTGNGHATCNIARTWLVHFGLWEQVTSDDRFNPASFRLRLEESHIEGVVEQLHQLFEGEATLRNNTLPQNRKEESKCIISDSPLLRLRRPSLQIIQEFSNHEAFLWSGGRLERQLGDDDKHPALGRIALELIATLNVQNGLSFNELIEATCACKASVVAKCKALAYYDLAQIQKDEYGEQIYLSPDWREKLENLLPKLENFGRVQLRRVQHLTQQLLNSLNIFVHRRTHQSQTVRQRAGRIWRRWRREKDILLNMGSRLVRIRYEIKLGFQVGWLWKHALEQASAF
jgi:primase-polymerase (primpol)-like protein